MLYDNSQLAHVYLPAWSLALLQSQESLLHEWGQDNAQLGSTRNASLERAGAGEGKQNGFLKEYGYLNRACSGPEGTTRTTP
jgi:hypothetical protein